MERAARLLAFLAVVLLGRQVAASPAARWLHMKPTVVNSTGLMPPKNPSTDPRFNPAFRYQSSGIDFSHPRTYPVWTLPFAADWRVCGVAPPVAAQGSCAASWAFAAAAALDAARAIALRASQADDVSEQQLLDCVLLNHSCAAGGWPPAAFSYVARAAAGGLRLHSERAYPYVGAAKHANRCSDLAHAELLVRASSYEAASFAGALGLLLAAQHQPVVALIEADQPSFVAYDGRSVYADAGCFANAAVDHAVVIVGYNLNAHPPYWILQNSWGRQWGLGGYMKMAIQGGDGVCGINSSPGYYPIVQGRGACGPPNPCGSGRCVAAAAGSGLTNRCVCPKGTVSAPNVDGTSSCIIADVCSTLDANPCGFGACVSDRKGGYACMCPPGFLLGTSADDASICQADPSPRLRPVYKTAGGETCYLVAVTYGLTVRELEAQNRELDCGRGLPPGAALNVSNPMYNGCSSFYPVDSSGAATCAGIAQVANISLARLLAANRGLNCSLLLPGMQVCIGPDPYCSATGCDTSILSACTRFEAVRAGDTCAAVAARRNVSLVQLYRLNPGVFCGRLAPRVRPSAGSRTQPLILPGTQLCVNGSSPNPCPNVEPCLQFYCPALTAHLYTVRRGDTCASVIFHQFRNNYRLFRSLNRNYACESQRLYVGEPLCAPGG